MNPSILAVEAQRLRGKYSLITLEQQADAANTLATVLWKQQRHSPTHVATCCHYYQERNEASYKSRRKRGRPQKRK